MTNLRKRNNPDLEELERVEEARLEELRKLDENSPKKAQARQDYVDARTAVREAKQLSSSAQIDNTLTELDEAKESVLEKLRTLKTEKSETPEQETAITNATNDFVSINALIKTRRRQAAPETPAQTSEKLRVENIRNVFGK